MTRRTSPFRVIFENFGVFSIIAIVINLAILGGISYGGYLLYNHYTTNNCVEETFNTCYASSQDKAACDNLATERCQ